MPTSYSPIDESSYSDNSSFDAEAILGNNESQSYRPAESGSQFEHSSDHSGQTIPSEGSTRQTSATATAPDVNAPSVSAENSRQKAASTVRPNRKSGISKAWSLVKDSRTAMFIGLLFVVFAAYTLLVSISYFANIGNDQSAVLNDDYSPEMIKNAGGPFGAWLAHTILYNWLGIGSFILIYYLAVCGLSLLKVYRPNFWSLTLNCLLTAISLSVVCGLVTYEMASPIYWGGRHGHFLNERLITFTGIWGALGVSIVMIGMVIFLYLTKLKMVCGVVSEKYGAYRTRQAERRAERERIEAEEEAAKAEQERQAAEARRAEEERRIKEERRMEEKRKAAADSSKPAVVSPATAPKSAYEPTEPAAPAAGGEVTADATSDRPAPLFTKSSDITSQSSASETSVAESYEPAISTSSLTEESVVKTYTDSDDTVDSDVEDDEEYEDDTIGADETASDEEITDTDICEPLFSNRNQSMASPSYSATAGSTLYDPRADLSHYKFPSIELLREVKFAKASVDAEEMEENKARITKTLYDYGIPISKIEATVGPTVTLYEIIPAEGVRIAKIKRLEDDIALSLAALGIRIIAPIPGKGTIGIEVPNKDPQTVSMRSVIESAKYQESTMDLPMAMGCTISNEIFMADLCKMPHLLVAGATGMGKSVGLNAIIASLLYKKHPEELKFVLIDPKMVEFSLYAKLERHYLAKLPDEEDAIITDPSKVVATLNSLCVEMDNRYALLKDASMRNIKEYNDRFIHRMLNPEKGHKFLPYIVVVVDEFADLIMTAGKEVETPIARIAQKARAVGIHMILATQRPSTNVITGVIKANFPGRIAFRVFQMVDSRTIIDRPGANQLIGRGDMLFSNNGKIDRVQCAFIDTPEVKAMCDAIDVQPGYDHAYELPEYIPETTDGGNMATLSDRDPLFDEAARFVVTTDTASTSSLQRRYSIGYNRAGKIMDQMEAAGIVGPSQGGKPRNVLVDSLTLERILENA